MKQNEYKIQSSDRLGFPLEIDLNDRKNAKIRRWVQWKYPSYSETLVWKHTVQEFPEMFGIHDRGPKTWATKAMCQRVEEVAEEQEIRKTGSDEYAVMPGVVGEHLYSRIGAYVKSRRRFTIHNCLMGTRTRDLSSHLFLQEGGTLEGRRDAIYTTWNDLMSADQWKFQSVGEFWRYGRFFAKKNARCSLRVEIWYDFRKWSKRGRLL